MTGPNALSNSSTELPDPVEILVGPAKRSFLAPRRLLTRVPYFRKCLDAPTQESKSGIFKFPEDNEEAFVEIVDYIFNDRLGGKLEVQTVNASPHQYVLRELNLPLAIKTYNLARKLGIEILPNRIINEIDIHKYWKPEATRIEFVYIFQTADAEEMLRDFLLDKLASSICNTGWSAWVQSNKLLHEEFFNGKAENMDTVLRSALPASGNSKRKLAECDWHIHDSSPECGKSTARPKPPEPKRPRFSTTSAHKESSNPKPQLGIAGDQRKSSNPRRDIPIEVKDSSE